MELISKDNIVKSPFPAVSFPKCDLWTFLNSSLEQNTSKIALRGSQENRFLTYKELKDLSEDVACNLLQHGFNINKPVAICMQNSVELIITIFAVLRLGGIVALLNHLLIAGEIKKALELIESELFICDRHEAHKDTKGTTIKKIFSTKQCTQGCLNFSELFKKNINGFLPPLPNVDPNEATAVILFSSGTTGKPKAVEISHAAVIEHNAYMRHATDIDSFANRGIIYQPISHVYGFVVSIMYAISGKEIILMDKFDLEKYIALVAKYQIDLLFLVPPTAVRFCKSDLAKKYNLSHIKAISIGGAPLGKEVEDQLQHILGNKVKIIQGYGMTELTAGCIRVPPYDIKIPIPQGSIGWPISNTFAKIADLATKENLGPNQEGEICIKCSYKMKGYLKNPEATSLTIDKDGWLHSGDIGYFDNNGCFFVVDRLKELIKYKGYQVSPSELEGILLTHQAIADAGITSVPDMEAGELPFAWVQLKAGFNITEEDIHHFMKERVAPFKRIRGGIKFVDAIPKSGSGKILRRLIKYSTNEVKSKL